MTALLFDLGNTRLKWRLDPAKGRPDEALLHRTDDAAQSACEDDDARFGAALALQWAGLKIEAVHYCSVAAPPRLRQVLRVASALWPDAPHHAVTSSRTLGGIHNGYRQAAQLGTDRLLAMVGARRHVSAGALLVASLGTATTLDLVDTEHRFVGGVILPGPMTMARALSSQTAQLPTVDLLAAAQQLPAQAWVGTDTQQAMLLGVLTTQLGAIERLRRLAELRLGEITCVLSGGGARAVVDHLPFSAQVIDNLVLEGLTAVYASNPVAVASSGHLGQSSHSDR